MFCLDFFKLGLKMYYFLQHQKGKNNSQMAKPFYICQIVSKSPNGNPAAASMC